MQNMNERPICHRAEDLVTYLYGEASAAAAQDFAGHLQKCDACRAEFAIFNQVHESIVLWRNEALGLAVSPAAQVSPALTEDSTRFVRHERKLSALAALREFFNVSPLWLRGATTFASLLLCLLVALAALRLWQKPAQVANKANEPKYSQEQLNREVQKQVDDKVAELKRQTPPKARSTTTDKSNVTQRRVQLASNSPQPRTPRTKGLTRQEREQLAADLRLIPGKDEDVLPFVFPDEPN
jgi:hypothetical protein